MKVELKSDRATYAVGDTFKGTISFTNTSSSQNDILSYDSGWFIVDVYDFWGHLVLEYPEVTLPEVTPVDFAPHETKIEPLVFHLERTDTVADPLPPIPAGSYRLYGVMDVSGSPGVDLNITIE